MPVTFDQEAGLFLVSEQLSDMPMDQDMIRVRGCRVISEMFPYDCVALHAADYGCDVRQ